MAVCRSHGVSLVAVEIDKRCLRSYLTVILFKDAAELDFCVLGSSLKTLQIVFCAVKNSFRVPSPPTPSFQQTCAAGSNCKASPLPPGLQSWKEQGAVVPRSVMQTTPHTSLWPFPTHPRVTGREPSDDTDNKSKCGFYLFLSLLFSSLFFSVGFHGAFFF